MYIRCNYHMMCTQAHRSQSYWERLQTVSGSLANPQPSPLLSRDRSYKGAIFLPTHVSSLQEKTSQGSSLGRTSKRDGGC